MMSKLGITQQNWWNRVAGGIPAQDMAIIVG